jgi:hypothetical protein
VVELGYPWGSSIDAEKGFFDTEVVDKILAVLAISGVDCGNLRVFLALLAISDLV